MKTWKHKILPTLLAGTLTLSLGTAAFADSDKGNNGKGNGKDKGKGQVEINLQINFYDTQNHWAGNIVKLMVEKGVIKGYEDNSFRPNKPVTQLEAITMVVNLLTKNSDVLTDGDSYIGSNVPSWAKDNVRLALVNGLIDSDDLKNPNKPATRMFVIKLLVNALGADLEDGDNNNLFFGDIDSLSSDEKAYLSFALLQSLVAGYEDKTFKPNKPVTRAEMAIFVNRLLGKVDINFGNNVSGTIAEIDLDDEEIKIGSRTYEVSDDAVVKIDGKTSDFEDLKVGMKVQVVIENDEIKTINATTVAKAAIDFKVEKITDGKEADDVEEAVKTGSRLTDTTPDLSDQTLYIGLNEKIAEEVNVGGIDGTEDDGFEVAEELEEAIADALDEEDRVLVTFDDDDNRFVFETNDSPSDEVPSIRFEGRALNELGLDTSLTKGSLGTEAVAESLKITVKSDATSDETYAVQVKDGVINQTVEITVDEEDNADDIADKIADALYDNERIRGEYTIKADDKVVTLTSKNPGEDLNLAVTITRK
ncbi:S-layer homology domain-containing protein [Ammoniphilus sp. 3BR4]|uniref:S-layer homology domain-containing protein n=1 Tax=Ammoniphilus sp. 3BR4 TaxID=3158265 RepID=UPI0034662478